MTYDMHDEHPMTDVGRQAAHILLDAIAAWDGADPNNNFDAPQLAIDRLFEIGAVRVVNHP